MAAFSHLEDDQDSTTRRPGGLRRKPRAERAHIVWDEENLQICEASKSAKMKIDEPKTPYNHLYCSSSGSDGEGDTSEGDLKDSGERKQGKDSGGLKSFQIAQAVQMAQEARSTQPGSPRSPSVGFKLPDVFSTPPPGDSLADPSAKANFAAKRKQHYNEWQFIKSLPQSFSDEEEEQNE